MVRGSTEYVSMDGLGGDSLYEPMLPGHVRQKSATTWGTYFKHIFHLESFTFNGRLMDRSAPFQQSLGRMNIQRNVPKHMVRFMYLRDLFHTLLNLPSIWMFACVFSAFITAIIIWSVFWWIAGTRYECGLGFKSYWDALYISMETLSTIGYGVPDVFFNQCPNVFFIVLTEYFCGLTLDAICLGLIFNRILRPVTRARGILLSGRAVMVPIRGQYHLLFQIVDARKHQLVEAHVRCYAFRHVRGANGETTYFQSHYMKLNHPNDDLGGMIILNVPCMVVHRVDAWSPLLPPQTGPRPRGQGVSNSFRFPEVLQRAYDFETGGRGIGTIPGEPITEDDIAEGAAQGRLPGGGVVLDPEAVRQYWRDCKLEIAVFVEGIDAVTSSSFQKRHSFTADDIEWDRAFVSLVHEDANGGCVVDYDSLHTTRPLLPGELDDLEPVVSVM
eukprot:m.67467 g.67467  ORF g.67467 m.67467 type:complete len:443 (+) comp7453_c0_seq2:36-1364(+)